MNYFAKYLPVEGQTKTIHYCEGCNRADMLHCAHADYCGNVLSKEVQVTKLFLCSRDIQVGDIVFNIKENIEEKIENNESLNFIKEHNSFEEIFFKKIGEISPEAKWVKEGDEFDEDQVEFWIDDGEQMGPYNMNNNEDKKNWNSFDPEFQLIKIKGPCGHFH